MTLTIDVKNSSVLTLLRDMEQLDLLHVVPHEVFSPASALPAKPKKPDAEEFECINRDAEYLNRKAREAQDIELINRDAEWLNTEALDVLSYQDLDL
jgi:hypothetical protein